MQATAPGYKAFKTQVMVTNDGDRKEVVVTRLEVLSAISQTPGTPPPATSNAAAGADTGPSKDGSGQKTIGYVVGAIGVAGIAVGAVTGLIAIGKNNDSKKECPNDGACASKDAVDAHDSAKTFGTVSTIAFIAGGVAVATGAVLIFTAPPSRTGSAGSSNVARRGIRVVPATDGRSGGLSVAGIF